jgi:hypothetical protein
MTRAAAAILALLLTGCASSWQPGERFAAGMTTLDAGTTVYAIGSGYGHEANPIVAGDSDAETALRAVVFTAATWWLVRRYLRDASPEEQRRAWVAFGIVRGVIAGWNITQIEKARK